MEQKNWLRVEAVMDQHERAAEYVAASAKCHYKNLLEAFYFRPGSKHSESIESPLEAIFDLWWVALLASNPVMVQLVDIEPQGVVQAAGESYRVDFLMVPVGDDFQQIAAGGSVWPSIAIELDGHAFHEKTKEQVAYRNKRDRDLQRDGWKVFHFSWSEVVRDPLSCVAEVRIYGDGVYRGLRQEMWARVNG